MARLVDENFEGAGYEGTWAETVSGSNTLDEDSAIPGAPPLGSGSQCLKSILVNASNPNAVAFTSDVDSNQNVNYVRIFLYVETEGFSDGETAIIVVLRDSSGNPAAKILMAQTSGQLKIRYEYFSAGADQVTAFTDINTGQWYLVEYQYDITGSAFEWWLDDISQASGALSAAIRTPFDMGVGGLSYSGSGSSTWFIDLVVWDDTEKVGPEVAANKRRKAAMQNLYLMN